MLLRVRVTLPDRPGALGQVARTLGVCGADIVQVVVLERLGGRAVDDFTVVWSGASRVDRLLSGLAAIPGVQVDGVWRAVGAPVAGGHDAELLAQVAGNPDEGLPILVDAVANLVAADWAAAVLVRPDWPTRAQPAVAYASWTAPSPVDLPDVTPLRARALDGPDGTRYAAAPFGRAGLVLLVARAERIAVPAVAHVAGATAGLDSGAGLAPAAFHVTEVDRVAQLVRAAAVILGPRLEKAAELVAAAIRD